MKTYCKNIDITDRKLAERAVFDCLDDKYTRGDTLRLLGRFTELSKDQIRSIYHRANLVGEKTSWRYSGKLAVRFLANEVVDKLENDLKNRSLEFVPIQYKNQKDRSSGKLRRIGVQDVYQQICDYVAVYALEPIFKRFGEYQCASIKGRGQIYGVKAIEKWSRGKGFKYFAKADVRKCFESINVDILLNWMRERVRNEPLMWLVEILLRTFERGLSIGSFLSQHLCNLFMSIIYHFLAEDEGLTFKRRDVCERYFEHQLFYMDDIFLSGRNKSKLIATIKTLNGKAINLGLSIKPTWIVRELKQAQFVDIMGVKIYASHTTIRKSVWQRIRGCMLRLNKAVRCHLKTSVKDCQKILSYYGILKHTDSMSVRYRYGVDRLLRIAKGVMKNESKNGREKRSRICADSIGYGSYLYLSA